jgi:hypothetical protein
VSTPGRNLDHFLDVFVATHFLDVYKTMKREMAARMAQRKTELLSALKRDLDATEVFDEHTQM